MDPKDVYTYVSKTQGESACVRRTLACKPATIRRQMESRLSKDCRDAYYSKAEKTLEAGLRKWQEHYERLTIAETLAIIQNVTSSVTLTLLKRVLLNRQ